MPSVAKSRLLIVEDDDLLRNRLQSAMERRYFVVRTASTVAEGLAAADAELPDYAVVDLRLPDDSGLAIVEAFNKHTPAVRTLILTGYGNIPTAVAAARSGAIDYLAKPKTADEIVDALVRPRDELPSPPDYPMSPEQVRWEHIEQVFHAAGDNVSRAARLLDMHRRTLQRILRRHKIPVNATQ